MTDQLSSNSGYGGGSSHRYSTVSGGGHTNPSSGYSSSAYPETAASSVYTAHSNSNADALNSISGSYSTSDGQSDSPSSYSGSSNAETYSSGSNHGPATFSGYTGSASTSGLTSNDHTVEYSSPSTSYSSSLNNYAAPGSKTVSYANGANGHVHSASPYSSGSAMSYLTSSHGNSYPGSHSSYPTSHLSSYPGRPASPYPGVSHSSFSDGPRYPSAQALSNYLSSHSSAGPPSSFIHSSGGPTGHRGSLPSFLLGAASNPSASFSKVPGPFYSGAFPKSSNKFIIIKEGGGHSALMHPGEPSFPSRMFSGASGYKVRSAGPFSTGPHMAGSSFVSSGYPGSGGHHAGGGPGSSYYYQ